MWAARQRAELSRLALAARSARMKADRAEQAEREALLDVTAPADLLSVLDSMLDSAVRTADRAIQAARRDAAAFVAAEHEWATDHLRSIGLDPVVVVGPSGWTSSTVPDVARPASAAQLWQDIEVDARRAAADERNGVDPHLVPEPVGAFASQWLDPEPADDADAELIEACWGGAVRRRPTGQLVAASLARSPPGSTEPGVPGQFDLRTGHAPTPQGFDAEPLEGGGELFDVFWRGPESVDVFWGDLFWDDGEQRRPLRDLLRRRAHEGRR